MVYLVGGLKKYLSNLDYYLAFFYGQNVPLVKMKVTSRKSTSMKFVSNSILKPNFWNTLIILFPSLFADHDCPLL